MTRSTKNLLSAGVIAFAAVIFAAIFAYAGGTTQPGTQPTTQPTTLDGLLSGVQQPLQTQIRDSLTSAHLDPTTLPAVSFVTEGDITSSLNAAKPSTTLYLKPTGSYTSNTANVTGAGVHIIGDNTTPANIKISKTGVVFNAPGIDFSGVNAQGFAKLLQVNKPGAYIHDCTASSLSMFAVLDADNFLVENITGSKIGGNFFYVTGSHGVIRNVKVTSMTSPNSEYCIRTENDGTPNGRVCTDLLIDRCDFTNDSTSQKPALGFREYQDLAVGNTTVHGYIVFGQNGKPPAGKELMRASLKDDKFPGPASAASFPKGGTLIDIRDGCDVTLDGITFGPFTDPKQSCIHVKGTSKLHYRNLTVLGTLAVPVISSDPGAAIEALP